MNAPAQDITNIGTKTVRQPLIDESKMSELTSCQAHMKAILRSGTCKCYCKALVNCRIYNRMCVIALPLQNIGDFEFSSAVH